MTARRPTRRRRRSPGRSRKRKQAYTGGEMLLGIIAIIWLLSRQMHWLAAHPWVLPLSLLTAGAGAFLWYRSRAQQWIQRQTQVTRRQARVRVSAYHLSGRVWKSFGG